jgi:hypothetical protein
MLAKPLLALAAVSLAASGTAASAQSAAPLSLAHSPMARQGAALNETADLRGGVILPVLIGILVIGMLVFVVKELGDDNDLPVSS